MTVEDNAGAILGLLDNLGSLNVQAHSLSTGTLALVPPYVTPGSTSGVIGISTDEITLGGSGATIELPAPKVGNRKTVYVIQDATGGRTVSWSSASGTIKWATGSAPTLQTAAHATTKVTFECFDGVNWFATVTASVAVVAPPAAAVTHPALSSGTPYHETSTVPTSWLIPIGGHAAGTVKVTIGATTTCSTSWLPTEPALATGSAPIPVRLPAGWWIKVTVGGTATVGTPSVVNV